MDNVVRGTLWDVYHVPMLVPTLMCPECRQVFVLPYHRFLSSDVVESYWPDEPERLCCICDRCSLGKAYEWKDINWREESRTVRRLEDEGFWRIQIRCNDPDCAYPIIGHVRTFGMTSRAFLGVLLATCHPTPLCKNGHPPNPDSTPLHLDFVDWNGVSDYLS